MGTGYRPVLGAALLALVAAPAVAADAPGVTKTEIRIGQTMPYSGPASAYAAVGKGEAAFVRMVNDQGGINGRKIVLISLDDGYSPPKTLEQTRKLIEEEGVAFIFQSLGTASNSAIEKYLNDRKVPQLFVASGADKWADYTHFPWTIGWQPSYRLEAEIYARYILKEKPGAKIGVIYQNDDFGKDYVAGLKDGLGDKYDSMIVAKVSYEVTDATVDSQIVELQGSGADTLVTAATPKFAAQTIRKVYDIGWKPLHVISNVSSSIASVFEPAGKEKAVGIVTAIYGKDPTDPHWKDDPGVAEYRAFMEKYLPEASLTDTSYAYAFSVGLVLAQVLRQCGDDLSSENIMRQATNLHDLAGPLSLPGTFMNTSPTNYHPIRQMQMERFNGRTWELFGRIIEGGGS